MREESGVFKFINHSVNAMVTAIKDLKEKFNGKD
ncbi:hypothetical protein J2S15_003331 [Breznakia pachnodae]|uniref:Uncharacterized protein n=1 Tax=Breznakia pachnodae TaxID=265178 RepID=A0ABU0E6P2_9FIRM|nr:hypothetical protein [Breznakia pachnodae]